MASASTPSVNEPKGPHSTQLKLKPMIKAQISGTMVSSGISDVAFVSAYSEKTRLKKWIMIIIIITEKQFTSK